MNGAKNDSVEDGELVLRTEEPLQVSVCRLSDPLNVQWLRHQWRDVKVCRLLCWLEEWPSTVLGKFDLDSKQGLRPIGAPHALLVD